MLRPLIASMLAVSAAHAAPPRQITLGAALPLSGAESKSGSRLRDGYQLAVELANQQGGVEVVGEPRPVKLILVDDKSDGRTDERAVEELVWQGVDVMLGTFGSSLVEKGSAVSERLKTPYVSGTGASRALYQRGFKYMFGLQAPIEQLANALMRWAEEEQQAGKLPSRARVAVIWEKTAHGKEYAETIKDFANKTPRRRAAWQLVMDDSFELNSKDFKPILERLKAANADVVLVDAHLPDYITMHGQYAKMGLCRLRPLRRLVERRDGAERADGRLREEVQRPVQAVAGLVRGARVRSRPGGARGDAQGGDHRARAPAHRAVPAEDGVAAARRLPRLPGSIRRPGAVPVRRPAEHARRHGAGGLSPDRRGEERDRAQPALL